eukprot:6617460-Pyramimonas_sp.AAC.1
MVCRTVIPSAPLRDRAQLADPSWPRAPLVRPLSTLALFHTPDVLLAAALSRAVGYTRLRLSAASP